MIEGQPPWSYARRAGELMRASVSVLDMDTGGGEQLLALRDEWPTRVVATEAHPPNVELARMRLEPQGCSVVDVPGTRMPMPFAAQPRCVSSTCPMFIREGTPSGLIMAVIASFQRFKA